MEFKIENTAVYGLDKAVIASGNAMRTTMDDNTIEMSEKDFKRGCVLGQTGLGEGHDQFLTGILVSFDIYAPLYQWKEIQRYKFLNFISSQSTMHRLAKFNVKEQCVSDTDEIILNRYQVLLDEYNEYNKTPKEEIDLKKQKQLWRTLVASLPAGFVLGATMTTNYRQLKTMYLQRKDHKLKEWHEFCRWCETLPYFLQLTGVKKDIDNE